MNEPTKNPELEVRVVLLEQSLREIRDNTTKMAGSLESLTRLEERHAETSKAIERAFIAIKESRDIQQADDRALADRLAVIEQEMPLMKIARNLVFTFCGGCTILVLMYVARLAGLWTGSGHP